MNDVPSAPVGDSAPALANTPAVEMSIEEGFQQLVATRATEKPAQTAKASKPVEPLTKQASEPPAEPEELSSPEDNAAPPEAEAHSEEPDAAEPEDNLPPIEPPRSWTKAEKDRFQSLPRETQEYLHTREQERERDFRRTQNEVAESRKAAEAERKQAEETRKAYEAKLPALMESLQRQSEFADIRSMDDVKNLQQNDPFRFQAWQIYQMDAQAVDAERRDAEQRQRQDKLKARETYTREQTAKLNELLPELADPVKGNALRSKAVNMLVDDYGFTEGELGAIMAGDEGFKLLNDARWQKLIADGLKYAEIRKAPPKAVTATTPPVQRPGVAQPRGASQSANIQALSQKLSQSGSVEDALAMLTARRAARR